MKISQIICEMNTDDAIRLFSRLGYDVSRMSPDEIKTARNLLMKKYHPDRGGDGVLATNINLAYDLLKNYRPQEIQPIPQPQQTYYQAPPRKPPETEPERSRNDFRNTTWSKRY